MTLSGCYDSQPTNFPDPVHINLMNEQCAEMWTTGYWNDVPCWEGPRAYLCEVAVPTPAYTFPCGAAVVRALALQIGTAAAEAATCRYDVSALSVQEKMAISWDVARDRCIALGGGARLAEPRTTLQTQFLAHALREHGAESLVALRIAQLKADGPRRVGGGGRRRRSARQLRRQCEGHRAVGVVVLGEA